jgi:hypothetical protein
MCVAVAVTHCVLACVVFVKPYRSEFTLDGWGCVEAVVGAAAKSQHTVQCAPAQVLVTV